eukprot:62113_1
MSQIATACTGEGNASDVDQDSLSIKAWMTQHKMLLRDEIYAALSDEGIITIGHMKQCTMQDMNEFISLANQRDEFQGNKKIKLLEKRKLKKTYETVTAFDPHKKHFIDPEELSIFKSIDLKIKTFEDMLKNLESKEVVIKQQKEKVSNDIHNTFNKWIATLNERKTVLLQKLDAIIQQKNQMIKTKMNQYEDALDKSLKIKTDTHTLLNTPLVIDQLAARKLQIAENEKSVTKIIDENKRNDIPIATKIFVQFVVDPVETNTCLSNLGAVFDADLPILQDARYDNQKGDGQVNIVWKLPELADKDKEQRKLCVEYICSDAKSEDDIDHIEIDADDEKKWNSKAFDVEKELNEGTSTIVVGTVGIYLFRLKYMFRKNTLSSPYSNIKSVNVQQTRLIVDSKIITDEEKAILKQWFTEHVLKEDKHKKITLSLLYRMSRDGKDIKKAQPMYAGKGPTLTLIQPRDCDNVCGGYASVSWDFTQCQPKADENAFVFLLRSQSGDKPQIFKPKDTNKALSFHTACGPSWGSNCVLRIYPQPNYDAYSNAPGPVYDIPANALLGAANCWLKDYEVYQVTVEN